MNEPLFADFCRFAQGQIDSGDLDPMYWLLEDFYEDSSLDEEARLWRTFLYVTFYHVGSAEKVWAKYPYPSSPDLADLMRPTGTERRVFRGQADKTLAHINGALAASKGNFTQWVQGYGVEEQGWDNARKAMSDLPYGGPWSAYKWADLLKNVHHLPLTSTDLGVGGGSETAGPIPGMVRITGLSWRDCASSLEAQRTLLAKSLDAGVSFKGLDQLETALCDFNSLCKGHYYMGHDIDDQMNKLEGSSQELWAARKAFADKWRGEKNDWTGVRKELKPMYLQKGWLANVDERPSENQSFQDIFGS